MSSELNYKNLRTAVANSHPPLIPFPGVYQGDLVFLETCLKNTSEGGHVNFQKFEKLSAYVLEIQNYQQTGYNLESVFEIQEYIRNFVTLSDGDAYEASLVCEPRAK